MKSLQTEVICPRRKVANFSGALLVCSLMKTARQQEKSAPSEGEEPESHIQQWLGTWSWWPWGTLSCWDVTSTKPPNGTQPQVCLGTPLSASPWVGNRHSQAKHHGRVSLPSQTPWKGFPKSPPLPPPTPPIFLCKDFKMNLLRHLQGDRIENSFVLKPPAWCGLMDGAYLNQAWKYLVL